MANSNSYLYALLAEKLDRDPVEDMRERRAAGASWRAIERAYLLDHGVSVTDVTLRTWWANAEAEPAAS